MRRKLLRLEILAWSAGLLCLLVLLFVRAESIRAEQAAAHLQSVPPQQKASSDSPAPSQDDDLSMGNAVIGRLEVPALGLKVPILNDYDPDSLRRGVGRIKGTAVPGGLGNFVVAGHRDTYFRPLRRVANGMTMRVITSTGTFDYIVDGTKIVTPDQIDVLDIGSRPEMTLITCYPFDYIGAAPKRFIVSAHLVSVAGEGS